MVTLSRNDKKDTAFKHHVRLEPHPPLGKQTKEEAKHWVATYALFRFCNNMPLHRVLPPGPREYWLQLEQEKKSAPSHRSWEFDSDPFKAVLEVKKRQQSRDQSKADSSSNLGVVTPRDEKRSLPKFWSTAPEIKMDHALRDQIEKIIRTLMARIPLAQAESGAQQTHPHSLDISLAPPVLESKKLHDELVKMGFRSGHVSSALGHLSRIRNTPASASSEQSSDLVRTLLRSFQGSSDRDALLQYLTIVVPEDDLPIRFRPTHKSTSFITAISSAEGTGSEQKDLPMKWMLERMSKLYGFPLDAISTTLNGLLDAREGVALEILVRRLAGWETDTPLNHAEIAEQKTEEVQRILRTRDEKRKMEREALEAIYGSERYRTVPEAPTTDFEILLTSDSHRPENLWFRVSFHPHSLYPTAKSLTSTPSIPTFSIISSTVPSYLRLALVKKTLERFYDPGSGWSFLLDAGEGNLIFEMISYIEEIWRILAENPPDVADVMYNFVIAKQPVKLPEYPSSSSASMLLNPIRPLKEPVQVKSLRRLPEIDEQLLNEQDALRANNAYDSLLRDRQGLPAWSCREEFLNVLSDPAIRVIVVAGETGSGKTTQLPQFVLESAFEAARGSLVNIICTQPRRVSAIGVATRVANERLEDIEKKVGIVGYAIRGEKRASHRTKLLFATTGVLLRRLATSDPDLLGVSHLFVDEVHERSVEIDLLLLELRKILARNKEIKIILMSATFLIVRRAKIYLPIILGQPRRLRFLE